jgi:purine-nucleoside phosphorylase
VARPGRRVADSRAQGRGARGLTSPDLRALARDLAARTTIAPRIALSLDADAGRLGARVDLETRLAGGELGEGAELLLGRLGTAPVAIVAGPTPPVVPLRLARALGAGVLVVTRTVHALDPAAETDRLGVVEDHIGLLVPSPLVGANPDDVGPRFPDLSVVYDPALRALARAAAERFGARLAGGVYAAHPDPELATPAELRMLRGLDADWVGRGGVQEAVVARHAGMRVLGLVELGSAAEPLADLAADVVERIAAGA